MRAYSLDLRERVVGVVVAEGWSQAQAARVYGVSEPSVSRFVEAYRTGGDLSARHGGGGPKKLRLAEHGQALCEHLESEPDADLAARCEHLTRTEGIAVSVPPPLWRAIRALGWTRKKDLERGGAGPARTGGVALASATTSVFASPIDDFPTGTGTAGNLGINVASGTTTSGIDLTISGVIGSGGGLVKSGSGYLNLTGQNTFAGPVSVTAGTLNVGIPAVNNGGTGALGLSNAGKTITVSPGATLSGTVNNWFGNNGNADANLPLITVNGGTLSTTRYTTIGALALNGATVTATSSDTANYQAFALRGNVTVGGTSASTITSTNVTGTTGGYHLGANTTFTVASTGGATPDLAINAPLINQSDDFGSAAGGLTKAGAGTMALNATNTYTGATIINVGTLLVNGSTAGVGPVTVNNSGSVLGGTGKVSGATLINTGGEITGANLGTVGALILQSTLNITGGTYAVDISGTASDKLTIAGALSLSGANITFTGTPTAGTTYVLATEASETGAFNGTAPSGFTFQFNTTGTELDLVPVPEPATWVEGCLLVGLVSVSQRRRISGWLKLARG